MSTQTSVMTEHFTGRSGRTSTHSERARTECLIGSFVANEKIRLLINLQAGMWIEGAINMKEYVVIKPSMHHLLSITLKLLECPSLALSVLSRCRTKSLTRRSEPL